MKTLSVRLPEQYIHDIEEAAGQESVDKGAMVRKLIGSGLKEYRIKKAFESYVEGKISLWKAANQAGLTYRGALEELKIRNIPFRYEKEDLDVDIYWALQEK
jgi:predicted HTH domain antitoxin